MFAVIRTGGKQYKVAANDILEIERLDAEAGSTVEFSDVLMLGGEGTPVVGTPLVAGATVAAEVVAQVRGERIIVFKKRRRRHYRRRNGHRQLLTTVQITEILTDGRKPAAAQPKPEPEAAPAAETEAEPSAAKAEARTEPKVPPKAEARPEPEASARVEVQAASNPDAPETAPKAKAMSDAEVEPVARPETGGEREEAEAAPAEPPGADDLSLIGGIGPKILKTLTELGYGSFRQIAELTPEQIEEIEAAIKMKGRVTREEWPDQARELMAGRGPRAKADRGKPPARKAAEPTAAQDDGENS